MCDLRNCVGAHRLQMLDRLTQHTEVCASCRGALRGVRRLKIALAAATVLLLAAAPLAGRLPILPPSAALPLSAAAVIAALGAAFLHLVLQPEFVYRDYSHSDISD